MPGENPIQPQTPAAPASAAQPAAPAVTQPAAPASILGADPSVPVAAAPAAADPAKPVVPERYEFKAPEGQQLDAAQLDAYSPVFKELGLTQEQAQKLVDKQIELVPKIVEAQQKQLQQSIAQETAQWEKASREDREFGGAQFDVNSKIANHGLAAFASPELKSLLVESGYANHPEFVRLFWNIGKRLSEAEPPSNVQPLGVRPPPEKVLYPSMAS